MSGNDPLRSGWYPDQPGLNPSAGGACAFGELWSAPVDGQVYASPLVDPGANAPNGTLLVATETNNVYGFDAVDGHLLWASNVGTPWDPNEISGPDGSQGCQDLTPAVGITGTPAIDPATHTAYFFAKTSDSAYKAHAIDLNDGQERPSFPVTISGNADNDPTASFDGFRQLQRPGLLLMNGVVYAAFGGHCDFSPYRGWVVGVNASTGAITTRWTDEALLPPPPNPLPLGYPGGGIWESGGRLVNHNGDILLVSGNGVVPGAPTAGSTPPNTLSEAALRLRVVTTPGPLQGHLQPVDFFAPCNAQNLSDRDLDIGSGAPLALPDSFGTNPHLLLVVGKSPTLYLLNRDNFGGFQQGSAGSCPDGSGNAGDAIVSATDAPDSQAGVWATPAVWPGDGGLIYLPYRQTSSFAKFRAYRVTSAGGTPTLEVAGQSNDDPYGYGSSSAIVTSDGTTSGSALAWIVRLPDTTGVGAELRAYDANPTGGVLTLRARYPIGQGNKFTTPTVRDGRIYVGARDGNVHAFGALPQGASAQSPPPPRPATANQVPDREG